jgi:F-type H+-transporting ATPase subunit epsilon
MDKTLIAKIILPSGTMLETEATLVTIPGSEGVFGVLPGHVPLVSSVNIGVVTVSGKEAKQDYFVYGGIAQVTDSGVNIISEFAVDLRMQNSSTVKIDIVAFEKALAGVEPDSVEAFDISSKIKKYETLLKFL